MPRSYIIMQAQNNMPFTEVWSIFLYLKVYIDKIYNHYIYI